MAQNNNKTPNLDSKVQWSQDAEQSVLGSILIDNQALDVASDVLKSDDFFLDQHKKIFSCMLGLSFAGKPIDLVHLTNELHISGQLEAVGGAPYVSSLADGMPRVSNVRHYAEIVREKSHLRQVAHLSYLWQDQANAGATPSRDLIDEIDSSLGTIRDSHLSDDSAPKLLKDIISSSTDAIDRIFQGNSVMLGMPTGFADIDDFTAGWMASDFAVLGARPSAGKSALCIEFALAQARAGNPVLFFSLEMTRVSLLFRMISNVGRVNGHAMRTGVCSKEARQRILAALGEIRELPLWISEPTKMWSHQLVNKVRFFANRYKVKFVIVDYLQLVRAKAENRVQEVGRVSQDLKEAAKIVGHITGGALLAAAQLSRLAAEEEPRLDHLRESGAIEQDSDLVMFLWNPPEGEGEKDIAWQQKNLTIAKQRNGPVGRVKLMFESHFTSFKPITRTIFDETDAKQRSAGGN